MRLAIDTWNEQLPAALVISGQSKKHALPHILMLQLAKEWLILLLYRPYYRPVVRLPVNEDEGGDEVTSAAVQVREPSSLERASAIAAS